MPNIAHTPDSDLFLDYKRLKQLDSVCYFHEIASKKQIQ